jgi:hypothetical protein
MDLPDDLSLDELARSLAEQYNPLSLQYLAGALQRISEQQLSGLTPEQYWLAERGIVPTEGWKRD